MSFTHSQPGGGGGATDAANVTYHNPGFSNVELALDELLYVPLTASISHAHGVQLKGSTLADVTLSWSYNKAVVSQTVAGAARAAGLRTLTLAGVNLTAATTYALSGNDGTTTAAASVIVRFSNERFWGKGAPGLTGAGLSGLAGTDRPAVETRATVFTVTAGVGEKIYYAWPKRLGAATFVVAGFAGGFGVTESNFTNAAGFTETYYIAESASTNLGTTTVTVS